MASTPLSSLSSPISSWARLIKWCPVRQGNHTHTDSYQFITVETSEGLEVNNKVEDAKGEALMPQITVPFYCVMEVKVVNALLILPEV